MNPDYSSDNDVLDLLAQGFDTVEPLPDHVRAQAYGAFSLAAFDEALAELVFDSLHAASTMRGDESEARLLSFANDFVTLDLSLLADDKTMIGEMQPVVADELLIEARTGETVTVRVDEHGRFRTACADDSFRLRIAGHLVTPWVARS